LLTLAKVAGENDARQIAPGRWRREQVNLYQEAFALLLSRRK
jgi:hypothetical protein